MEKKKRLVGFLFAGVVFVILVGTISFLSGRQGRDDTGGKGREAESEETGNGKQGSFGSDTIVICLFHPDGSSCDFSFEETPVAVISLADRMISELEDMEHVSEAAAFYQRSGGNIYHGMNGLSEGNILGVGSEFLSASGFQVEEGRGLTERDIEEKNRVALLDGRASQTLFSGENPVGEIIEVEGRLYQVAGVIGLSDPQVGGGQVLIPESTWPEVYQYEEPKSVVLRLSETDGGVVSEAEWEQELEETGTLAARILNSMLPEGEELRYLEK